MDKLAFQAGYTHKPDIDEATIYFILGGLAKEAGDSGITIEEAQAVLNQSLEKYASDGYGEMDHFMDGFLNCDLDKVAYEPLKTTNYSGAANSGIRNAFSGAADWTADLLTTHPGGMSYLRKPTNQVSMARQAKGSPLSQSQLANARAGNTSPTEALAKTKAITQNAKQKAEMYGRGMDNVNGSAVARAGMALGGGLVNLTTLPIAAVETAANTGKRLFNLPGQLTNAYDKSKQWLGKNNNWMKLGGGILGLMMMRKMMSSRGGGGMQGGGGYYGAPQGGPTAMYRAGIQSTMPSWRG